MEFDMLDNDLTRPWVESVCLLGPEHSLTALDDTFGPLYEDNDDYGKTVDQHLLPGAVCVSYDLFPDLPSSLQSSDELSDDWMENADLTHLLNIAAPTHHIDTPKPERPLLSQFLQEHTVTKIKVETVLCPPLIDTTGIHVTTEITEISPDNVEFESNEDLLGQLADAPELDDVDLINALLYQDYVKALLPQDVELQLSPLSSIRDYESLSPSSSLSPSYDNVASLDYRTSVSPQQTSSDAANWSGSDMCHSDSDSDSSFKPYSRKKTPVKSSPKPKVVNIAEADLPKKERKKLQNKRAATRYRMKKKGQADIEFEEVDDLENRNKELHDKVDQLTREITYMKDLMAEIKKARATST